MSTDLPSFLTFPNPVNEKAARTVAAGVVVIAVAALATQQLWLTLVLAIGFLLRVASGPRFSPLGLLATKVLAPRLGAPKLVPGPPKRFAQAIGFVVTTGATVAWFGFSSALVANLLLAVIVVAAGLESAVGLCLGCVIFGYLMKIGVIPAETCEACNNISLRSSQTA